MEYRIMNREYRTRKGSGKKGVKEKRVKEKRAKGLRLPFSYFVIRYSLFDILYSYAPSAAALPAARPACSDFSLICALLNCDNASFNCCVVSWLASSMSS